MPWTGTLYRPADPATLQDETPSELSVEYLNIWIRTEAYATERG